MKLYEITEQLRQLMEMDDVPPEQLQDTLDLVQEDFDAKALQCAAFIRELDLEADGYKQEIDRLAARKKSAESKADSMREYVRHNMQELGVTKINGKLFTITLGKPSEVVNVSDVDKVPDSLVRIKREADKVAVKAQLAAGIDVPGCELLQGKPKLIIK